MLNSYYVLLGGTISVLHLPSTYNGTSCIIHQATFYYKRVREFVIHILSTCNTSTSCIIHQTDEIDSIFIANRFGTTYHKWNVSFLFHRWIALSGLTHLFIGFDMTSLECTRHAIRVMDNRCLISEISFASILGPAKVWGWFQGCFAKKSGQSKIWWSQEEFWCMKAGVEFETP